MNEFLFVIFLIILSYSKIIICFLYEVLLETVFAAIETKNLKFGTFSRGFPQFMCVANQK